MVVVVRCWMMVVSGLVWVVGLVVGGCLDGGEMMVVECLVCDLVFCF